MNGFKVRVLNAQKKLVGESCYQWSKPKRCRKASAGKRLVTKVQGRIPEDGGVGGVVGVVVIKQLCLIADEDDLRVCKRVADEKLEKIDKERFEILRLVDEDHFIVEGRRWQGRLFEERKKPRVVRCLTVEVRSKAMHGVACMRVIELGGEVELESLVVRDDANWPRRSRACEAQKR